MTDKLKNVELREAFGRMSIAELTDYKFLSNFIFNKVGLSLKTKKLKITAKMNCWGGLACKQYPDELAKLLTFLFKCKSKINSFFEIGTGSGGTFFVIDSFLRTVNPAMGNSLTIDRLYKIVDYDVYRNENKQSQFLQIDSNQVELKQDYDFCFIDGDHDYESCSRDFNLVKKISKIIALHDIELIIKGGVDKLWDEISEPKLKLLNEDPRFVSPLGIGVALL